MTDATIDAPRPARRLGPTTSKLAWLVALALATLIPSTLINSLIAERQSNEEEAKQAIAQSWGPAQTLTAPVLMLPFKTPTIAGHPTTTYARIRPQALDIAAEIVPERRRRGFFEATVYTATIRLKGTFKVPETIAGSDGTPILPPQSGLVALALSDASGVSGDDTAKVDGTAAAWKPLREPVSSGCKPAGQILTVPATLSRARGTVPFEATLTVRGTSQLQIRGLTRGADATIKGAWPSPSFIGDALPTTATVTPSDFSARWHVEGLAEPAVSASACPLDEVSNPSIGADLMEPMPIYRMVVRAAKYAPLFIALGFIAYFVFELSMGVAITILQYALMAASLSLFALLLVSLGEVWGYTNAYIASALLVVAQASIFTASVLRRVRPALGFATLLGSVFGFLYVLLGLETFALLIGSVALFLGLCLVMMVTQKMYRREPGEA